MNSLDKVTPITPFTLFCDHVKQMQSMGVNLYGREFKNIMALRLLFLSGNVAVLCRRSDKLTGYELSLLLNLFLVLSIVEVVSQLVSFNAEHDPPKRITTEPITPQAPPVTSV